LVPQSNDNANDAHDNVVKDMGFSCVLSSGRDCFHRSFALIPNFTAYSGSGKTHI
jgi:hypothetical protein